MASGTGLGFPKENSEQQPCFLFLYHLLGSFDCTSGTWQLVFNLSSACHKGCRLKVGTKIIKNSKTKQEENKKRDEPHRQQEGAQRHTENEQQFTTLRVTSKNPWKKDYEGTSMFSFSCSYTFLIIFQTKLQKGWECCLKCEWKQNAMICKSPKPKFSSL